MKILVLLLISFLVGHEYYLNGNVDIYVEAPSGERSIVRMPKRDANQLESFFRKILLPEGLAYTIAGLKPLSFTCFRTPRYSLLSYSIPNLRIVRGWKTWRRYKHHFENDRVKFWIEESPWVKGISCLILADGEQCHRVIQENFSYFEGVLNHLSFDLFKDVDQVPFFLDTLKMDEGLIGILLGYGKENALLYHQNNLKGKSFIPLPRIWNDEERKSTQYLWKYCTLQPLDISDLLLPIFVGNPNSEESIDLKKKYLTAKNKIEKYYSGRNFLSATLSLYKHGSALLEK